VTPSISICGNPISTLPKTVPADEPVFAEPWQAHAFALAVKLSEAGLFSWADWSAALGAELAEANRRGEVDDGSRYYHYWVAALERLVAAKNLVLEPALQARKREWEQAYRHTPHGEPVTLRSAEAAPTLALSLRVGRERGLRRRKGEGQ
jgi:nitrile hydratase accessory protein